MRKQHSERKLRNRYTEFLCDLCASRDAVEVPHCREYTNNQPVHICKNCGFVYVKYRRSAYDIARDWSNVVYGNQFTRTTYTARIPAVKARQVYVADFNIDK